MLDITQKTDSQLSIDLVTILDELHQRQVKRAVIHKLKTPARKSNARKRVIRVYQTDDFSLTGIKITDTAPEYKVSRNALCAVLPRTMFFEDATPYLRGVYECKVGGKQKSYIFCMIPQYKRTDPDREIWWRICFKPRTSKKVADSLMDHFDYMFCE